MDADLEPLVAHLPHQRGLASTDIGARQHRAVQQGSDAVVFDHRGPRHLPQKARPEHAFDRTAGMVGPEAEQEGRPGVMALEQRRQPRHAITGAAPGVYVDLEGEQCHQSDRSREATTWSR